MKRYLLIVFLILSSLIVQAQQSFDELIPESPFAGAQISNIIKSLKQIQSINKQNINLDIQSDDLIIGDIDPNEIVIIDSSYFLNGNLTIVNNGKLILDHASFQINGDITILGTGELTATGGSFKVIQNFTYEHKATILESGLFKLDSVQFTSSGQSWSFGAVGEGELIIKNSEISDGFITTGLFEQSSAQIIGNQLPGEFLCFGENNLVFNNNDWLLLWLVLADSSVINLELPDDSLLIGWQFDESQPGVSGISYSVTIDSCTNVNWGLISQSGSDATFNNTNFRVSGLMFNDPDSILVQNITNGSHYSDVIIDVPDRNLHLINTDVQTWNFYPFEDSKVTVRNSIFGEMITSDSAYAFIDNSVCDGSGGHLEASGLSTIIVFRSIINSQILSRNFSVLAGMNSAFMGTEIVSNDYSVIAILNTQYLTSLTTNQSSVIFDEQLPPVEDIASNNVLINGTAQLFVGPESTVQFEGYKVFYSPDPVNPNWTDTDGLHVQQVVNDTLAIWNTEGLSVGTYPLALSVYHTLGDSISLFSNARLGINTAVDDDEQLIKTFRLEQNYPNPFNPTTKIKFTIPTSPQSPPYKGGEVTRGWFVQLKVYDILGKMVATLVNEEKLPGEYEVVFNASSLPSGIYFYRLITGSHSVTKKLVLLK
jgi:Secretion system C-terminal sorting domain